jgi:hypothetical protein
MVTIPRRPVFVRGIPPTGESIIGVTHKRNVTGYTTINNEHYTVSETWTRNEVEWQYLCVREASALYPQMPGRMIRLTLPDYNLKFKEALETYGRSGIVRSGFKYLYVIVDGRAPHDDVLNPNPPPLGGTGPVNTVVNSINAGVQAGANVVQPIIRDSATALSDAKDYIVDALKETGTVAEYAFIGVALAAAGYIGLEVYSDFK